MLANMTRQTRRRAVVCGPPVAEDKVYKASLAREWNQVGAITSLDSVAQATKENLQSMAMVHSSEKVSHLVWHPILASSLPNYSSRTVKIEAAKHFGMVTIRVKLRSRASWLSTKRSNYKCKTVANSATVRSESWVELNRQTWKLIAVSQTSRVTQYSSKPTQRPPTMGRVKQPWAQPTLSERPLQVRRRANLATCRLRSPLSLKQMQAMANIALNRENGRNMQVKTEEDAKP